jgi:hypothetical protein
MNIYGDTNSGNCLKVKMVCDALALPYTWIDIDTRKRETRTTTFLKMNSAGQVPVVEFDDGRVLAESNAIIRYLARGSHLITADAFAISASRHPILIRTRSSVAMRRWRGWSISLPRRHSWSAMPSRSPMSRCWPIRDWRMRAAFTSTAMPPCGAGSARPNDPSGWRRRVETDCRILTV